MTGLVEGLQHGADGRVRCWWCGTAEDYVAYHDTEWGAPVTDDIRLFEKLSLEGFQAGLSWLTILRKRENFRAAFEGFEPAAIARFGARDVSRLLGDAGIVRHRGKIEAVINNSRCYETLCAEWGSLSAFIWSFEPTTLESGVRANRLEVPGVAPASVAMSKDLKRRGWKFVGPTTMYALFQAMGLVNDHIVGCFRQAEIAHSRRVLARPTR